jgi:hypothetical protein
MKSKRKILKMTLIVIAFALAVVASIVVATTRTDKTMGMTFYENDTFRFMVEVLPNDCVDYTCQGFWVRRWPSNPKCAAGVNFSVRSHQIEFALLRWSWKV